MAPFVAAITHPDGPDASGKIFEVGGGFAAEIRWERSKGAFFKPDATFTPSAVSWKSKVNPIEMLIRFLGPRGMGHHY